MGVRSKIIYSGARGAWSREEGWKGFARAHNNIWDKREHASSALAVSHAVTHPLTRRVVLVLVVILR